MEQQGYTLVESRPGGEEEERLQTIQCCEEVRELDWLQKVLNP
jgi:hypothetical protein